MWTNRTFQASSTLSRNSGCLQDHTAFIWFATRMESTWNMRADQEKRKCRRRGNKPDHSAHLALTLPFRMQTAPRRRDPRRCPAPCPCDVQPHHTDTRSPLSLQVEGRMVEHALRAARINCVTRLAMSARDARSSVGNAA